MIVRGKHAPGSVATCGRFVVERKSKATPRRVVAGAGVEVFGELDSHVETPGAVIVGPKGVLRGRVRARAIHVEPGADLRDVVIEILTPGAVVSAAPSRAAEPTTEPTAENSAVVVEAKPVRPPTPAPVAPRESTPLAPAAQADAGDRATRVTPGGTVRLRIG